MTQFLDNDGLKALWDKIKKTYALKSEIQPKGSYVSYAAKEATVAGTKKSVSSLTPSTLYVGNGLIMGGTAAAAGLVTRGICGVTTPDSTGACTKDSLYLNFDGDNNYSRKVILGAGGTGESLGTGCGYTYCAIRGDEMKKYVASLGYTKNTGTVTSVSVKINGDVKGTVTGSGTIDLGTYLTSHQSLSNYVTLNTNQTITGVKTFNAPKSASGEQATAVFKTANGGQIILGKEGPNSGSMIALDQVAGTRRLNFRASATPGAIVWSQPESNSSLYYDVTNVYFRECTYVSFDSASTIRFNKFTNASALGTDANGNLKKVSLAKVATSGSYNDLNNKPTILTTSDVNSLIADKFNKCVEITKFAYDGGTPTDPTDSYRTQIRNRGSDIIFESAYKPTNDGNYDFDTQPKAYSSILVKSDRIILGAENDHREGLSLVLTPNDIAISDGQEEFSVLDRSVVTSAVTSGNTNVLTSGGAYTALSKKQDTLVSGTNIKTVNNQSLLGSGNITIAATLNSSSDVTIRTLSFKKGSSYSISGIYCTKVQVTVGGSVGNEGSVSFSVSSDYQSSFANGNWYFVACPTHGSWIDTMCFGITDTTATGGKLWAKRALSAGQVTYDFTIIMVRLY